MKPIGDEVYIPGSYGDPAYLIPTLEEQTMSMIEIKSPTQGIVGWLHEIEQASNDSVLVFQLPRATHLINEAYIESARKALKGVLQSSKCTLIIGCDVNIYEIAGADAVILKLKGII